MMKKVNRLPIVLVIALIALLAVSIFGIAGGKTAKAEVDPAYKFEVAEYSVTYDIDKNCRIAVKEELTIHYQGYASTGFIRDIPVNGGVQVRGVDVKKSANGKLSDVWFDVYYEDSDFLSVDIGDSSRKTGKSESYVITYDYLITNSVVGGSMLPLNPIGHGWECYINNASVKLILPEGFVSAKCYIGRVGANATQAFRQSDENGRVVLSTYVEWLDKYSGVTFDLTFEEGAIGNFSDNSPYLYCLIGVAVLFVLLILKFLVFNKNYITPVVNYEAPNKMDPLLMGKLIDNKVNSEDVTSLIYYWAGKGFIKINLDDKDDPAFIRIMQTLPEPVPSYERLMYNSLFAKGDVVKVSELKYKFYSTVSNVTGIVNKRTKGLYSNASFVLSVIFSVISGLLLGFVPMILAFTRISSSLLLVAPFIAVVPMLFIYALSCSIMYNKLKSKKQTLILMGVGVAAACLITGLLYVFLVPTSVIGYGPKACLYLISCLISALSVTLISRTKQYTEQLNDIIGFKEFISLAEKDQLEMMLEDDPQFYYHILPYAQVLGVTDKWEAKFKDITIEPPQWLTGDFVSTYIEFRIINSMIRGSMTKITSGMVSRPSSSGVNGGGRGGFGGGFSGGGFGGGGGRGR